MHKKKDAENGNNTELVKKFFIIRTNYNVACSVMLKTTSLCFQSMSRRANLKKPY